MGWGLDWIGVGFFITYIYNTYNFEMMDRRTELMQLTHLQLVDLILKMEEERRICDLYWEEFDEVTDNQSVTKIGSSS